MDEKMAIALEGSIDKWERIADYLRYKREYNILKLNDLEQGSNNCPLCQYIEVCQKCIVFTKTNHTCCQTPYGDFEHARHNHDLTGMGKHCKREINFLKSLRD